VCHVWSLFSLCPIRERNIGKPCRVNRRFGSPTRAHDLRGSRRPAARLPGTRSPPGCPGFSPWPREVGRRLPRLGAPTRGITGAPSARPGAAWRGSSSSRRRTLRAGTAPIRCRGSPRARPARSDGRWRRPATGAGRRAARARRCRGRGCGTRSGPPAAGWRSGRRCAVGSCTAPG